MRSTPSRLAVVLATLRGQAAVVTDHGLGGGDWGGVLPRLFRRLLLVSEFSARVLGAPPERTRIILGGAGERFFNPSESESRAGVLFVGRLTPHKGIDRLIQALPRGRRLWVVGSEGHDANLPEREYPRLLQHLAMGREVDFAGPVPDEQLAKLYRRAAVLVLPSVSTTVYGRHIAVSELLGLAVLEAMASGTPVICSRLGGLPEVVEHGVTGYLVEPGNVAELSDRLSQLLGDPAGAARMGHRAREVARERFTWTACARRCLSAYHDVLQPSRGRFTHTDRDQRSVGA